MRRRAAAGSSLSMAATMAAVRVAMFMGCVLLSVSVSVAGCDEAVAGSDALVGSATLCRGAFLAKLDALSSELDAGGADYGWNSVPAFAVSAVKEDAVRHAGKVFAADAAVLGKVCRELGGEVGNFWVHGVSSCRCWCRCRCRCRCYHLLMTAKAPSINLVLPTKTPATL